MKFRNGRAEVFHFGEIVDELFHEYAVALIACRDDVAEQDEEGRKWVI